MASKRMNLLNGKKWLKNSISVWDIIKTSEENKIGHPAMFPIELCDRLIETFTIPGEVVLDPFMGCGSTLISAKSLGRCGIGFDINEEYVKVSQKRISRTGWATKLQLDQKSQQTITSFTEVDEEKEEVVPFTIPNEIESKIYPKSSFEIGKNLEPNSVDFVLTSPPYWDILRQKRTADYKDIRPYSEEDEDLGNIESYDVFIKKLGDLFSIVKDVLKPKKYCAIVVMDIRKKDQFYPFHSDLANEMTRRGFKFEDIIIWNRLREYNNLRALGYPYVFRVNKIHEYILIFSKV